MSRYNVKRPKLTFKAAKAIAMEELGAATKLTPHENNSADFQCYEMQIGNQTARISQAYKYPGFAYVSFAGAFTYYDIGTLKVDYGITDQERQNARREDMRDMAACDSRYMLKALIDEYGLESCHKMLDEAS